MLRIFEAKSGLYSIIHGHNSWKSDANYKRNVKCHPIYSFYIFCICEKIENLAQYFCITGQVPWQSESLQYIYSYVYCQSHHFATLCFYFQ